MLSSRRIKTRYFGKPQYNIQSGGVCILHRQSPELVVTPAETPHQYPRRHYEKQFIGLERSQTVSRQAIPSHTVSLQITVGPSSADLIRLKTPGNEKCRLKRYSLTPQALPTNRSRPTRHLPPLASKVSQCALAISQRRSGYHAVRVLLGQVLHNGSCIGFCCGVTVPFRYHTWDACAVMTAGYLSREGQGHLLTMLHHHDMLLSMLEVTQ